MSLFVRTLVIWLLVLAIPAQGVAAATMAFCGSSHHRAASPAVETLADVPGHSHHDGALSTDPSDSGADAALLAAGHESAGAGTGHEAKQKCSVCAACCSLGAMLTNAPVVAATDPVPTVFFTVVPTFDAFAADGPDRPPRNVCV